MIYMSSFVHCAVTSLTTAKSKVDKFYLHWIMIRVARPARLAHARLTLDRNRCHMTNGDILLSAIRLYVEVGKPCKNARVAVNWQ